MNLEDEDWESVRLTEDANTAYNQFHNIVQSNLNITCPLINSSRKRKARWHCWDEECSNLKNAYILALEQQILNGRAEDKLETTARKKMYDLKLRNLRKQQTAQYINRADNKSKALWQVINGERKAKLIPDNQITLQENGRTIEDPVEVAHHFNTFFATIAEKTLQDSHINTDQTLASCIQTTNTEFHFQIVTQKEVLKTIQSLKPKTSSGIDEISAKVIKICKEELSTPLTYLINKSLHQGIFPDKLQISKVYPKLKKGPTNKTNSYRPISLLSTFSKVIEKIVLEQLMNYLLTNNLLTNRQHGFLKNKSTTTALIQLVEDIIDQLEEGHIVTTLFLDFSKAFDCLSHNCLLNKLEKIGIAGKSSKWFRSYLSNRKQLVELQSISSKTTQTVHSALTSVQRGVPQGSVLGPVLFLLLTNDLPAHLESICQTVMFADDTVITLAKKKDEQLLSLTQEAFSSTKEYCSSNNLVLNKTKTVQLVFTTKGKEANMTPLGMEIKNNTKYLGITIDSSLSWTPHVVQLCKRLSSGIYVIRRLKQVSSTETARTAYFSLLESHLRYGIVVWGGSTSSNLEKVLIRQKRAVRYLAGLGYRDSCRKAFMELKILTVIGIYIQETIIFTALSTHPRNQDIHDYNTRNSTAYALPPHHLTLYSKKPTYAGAKFFNQLPDDIKNSNPQQLKRRLTTWLLERPFYSIEEFLNWRHFPNYA